MTDEFPYEAQISFQVPDVPYSKVTLPLTENPQPYIDAAVIFRELFLKSFPQGGDVQPAPQGGPPARVQAPVAPQQAPQRPQGQGRAERYPLIEGWACDVCNGPCGVYAKTGNMRSDKVVCLGRCKDGQYVHTVGWLD